VIKVFENFDFSRVGQMQSLLEAHGIETFIRNQYGSSVMGEVPFVEVVPQLFVLEERDLAQALELLKLDLPSAAEGGDWVCQECGVDVDANFNRCWKCGVGRGEG
jgi:Putative prokaryotic signal transducing protein